MLSLVCSTFTHFFSPAPTQKPSTIIKPSFEEKALLLFVLLNVKHSTLEQRKRARESSEEIYICIIFCCFKRQIKFYLFLCSNGFLYSFLCAAEIRDIYSFWIGGEEGKQERSAGARRGKQFIRKVSLWFNKSPPIWKCYLHSFSFFIAFCFTRSPSFHQMEEDEDINPLFEIIQLFFSCRNFFIWAKTKSFFMLYFLRGGKSIASDNEMQKVRFDKRFWEKGNGRKAEAVQWTWLWITSFWGEFACCVTECLFFLF